jgi:hypothetical protein
MYLTSAHEFNKMNVCSLPNCDLGASLAMPPEFDAQL